MKEEKVIKSYDPLIMRRLLGFTKPYRKQVAIAVISLLLATAAELAMPVLMQRTIDAHIIVSYARLEDNSKNREIIHKLNPEANLVTDGKYVYFSGNTGDIPDNYYLTDAYDISPEAELEYADKITLANGYLIIDKNDLKNLPGEIRESIRWGDISAVKKRGLLYLSLLIGGLIFTFLQVYLMAYTGQKVMEDIRMKLYSHTTSQSLRYLGKTPVGYLVTRITNDVETVNEFFTSVATSVLKDISLVAGVLATLFLLDARLASITVLSLPPVFIAAVVFRKIARNAYRKVRTAVSNVNTFLSEHISGMEIVQMFNMERKTGKDFDNKNQSLLRANLGEMYVFAVFRPLMSLFTAVSVSVILYFGAGQFLKSAITLGILIAFIDLIQKFYRPIMDFSEKFTILQSAMAGSERIFSILDTDDRIPDTGTLTLPAKIEGKIEFRNVSFRYNPEEPVLENLSFTVEPGQNVAIVGYTGAGKTTIANLITRLWDIDKGEILIDGTDIRKLNLRNLRKTIIPVQQDVFLFSGTIMESIRSGAAIPDPVVFSASEDAQAHSFIKKLKDGYNTRLDDRGTNISTGQRQLISFARVIARDPQIIILDEATGNVDTETEKLIQTAISKLMKGRTSLVIAHRLSTTRNADKILVLAKGRLQESGTHEELLAKKGLYYNLYKLQYEPQDRNIS